MKLHFDPVHDRGKILKLVIGNKNYSSWSLRAWLALAVTGADFEEILIQLDTPHMKADIARYSPAGRVPVLIDDGLSIWDSLAIIEYLADKFPAAGLWSEDSRVRAIQRSVSAEMHSGFMALRAYYPMNMRHRSTDRPATPEVQADIDRICSLWRQALSGKPEGGPFLFGRFSGADAMFAPVVSRLSSYAVPVEPAIQTYMDSVRAHPKFRLWETAGVAETWVLESEEV